MTPKRKAVLGWGLVIVVTGIIIGLVVSFCCVDAFKNTAPLVFPKELPAIPKECSPWYGCDWNTTPCKNNQDCASFRRCDEGKCILPK